MKWTIALVVMTVAALPLFALSSGSQAATTKSCAQVPFTPNSDDVAGEIRATGLTCGLARDFILDSEGRPGKRFRGFRCTSTTVGGATLPYTSYRCTGAGDVIRWRRY